ncbi:Hypothetical protein PBPRA1623 [Photobacterium profundum SS9]|uniref:TniQ domain-containing protein n=2 Tax=Photobacterium profundum TaxID=74109 RepID=Q6LRP2_PHOPR|nr:Hypothetical protein PBPRA1623 [Photobacterium profundum SS9]
MMELGSRDEYSLAIRYQPMAGESVKSFLLRLAKVNACSFKELATFLGINARDKTKFTPGSPSEQQVYESLVKALNVSHKGLHERLRTPEMKELWVPNVKGTSEMKIRGVRLCVSCLSESLYHRQAWQHAMYCVCPKHNEQLIEVCPNCDLVLEIETCIGGRCSHCASAVAGWQTCSVDIPTWQQQVLQGSESRTLLVVLLKMAMIAVRPTDLFPSDIRVSDMRINELKTLMDKAWVLLHSGSARTALKEALLLRWSGVAEVFGDALPLTLYRESQQLALGSALSGTIELVPSVFDTKARMLEIVKSTKRFALRLEGEKTSELIQESQLLWQLGGVKPRALKQLKEAGIFTQVNPDSARKDALFRLEDVAAKVSELETSESVIDGYVPYEELVPSACKFIVGLDEGNVLVDIFKQDLPAFLLITKTGTTIDQLFVDREAFYRKYHESEMFKHQTIPVTYLPSFFGTKMPNVEVLLATKFTRDIIDFNSLEDGFHIPTHYLKQIHDDFLILNKWAHTHKKSKTKCLCVLKSAKLEPLVRVNEKNCTSFEIYPKSAEQILFDRYDELAPNYTGKKKRRTK